MNMMKLWLRSLLISVASTDPEQRKIASRRLAHLKRSISSVDTEINRMDADPGARDLCLVRQREEQLRELKHEVNDISRALFSLDLDDGEDDLRLTQSTLDSMIFESSLIEKASASTTSDGRGVKLPKIEIPVFNGNIVTFWEQFSVAVHALPVISDSEKLVYQ